MNARSILVIGFVSWWAIPADVLTAEVGYHDGYFRIEGNIEPGDFEKFEAAVRKYGSIVNIVALASPGGDLLEAMKIGRLIREMKLVVNIPEHLFEGSSKLVVLGLENVENYGCSSSCFFVYVAGVKRGSGFGASSEIVQLRTDNVVGIHRPYLSKENYESMDIDDAFAASAYLRKLVSEYLVDMGVPATYADRMFAVPPNEIEWLSGKELTKYFDGYVPEMNDWMRAHCPLLTDSERSWSNRNGQKIYGQLSPSERQKADEIANKVHAIWECETQTHAKISCEAWQKSFSTKSENHCID